MNQIVSLYFKEPGRREYVLAEAGIYAVADTPGGSTIVATPKLEQAFGDNPIPAPEIVVPILREIVDICDRKGAIDMSDETANVIGKLQGIGMSHTKGAIGALFKEIEKVVDSAAKERGKQDKIVIR